MMNYLALIIEGIITPFIILGEIIGWIRKKYWDWIILGVKKAKGNRRKGLLGMPVGEIDDIYLLIAYWIVHIMQAIILGASPLLLLLLKSEMAVYTGIILTIIGEITSLAVNCAILDCETAS